MSDSFDDRLKAARLGDGEALEALLRGTAVRIRVLASTRLGKGLRADIDTSDVIQSTYFDVLRDLGRFAGTSEDDFVRWVGTVLENNVRLRNRHASAQKRTPEEGFAESYARRAAPVRTPSQEAVLGEDLGIARRALARLPDDYRQVLVLRLVQELPHEEIAEIMGRPATATRMLFSRARAALTLEIARLSGDAT